MKLGVLFAALRRESRGSRSRLVFLTACLALGVTAVVGVSALSGALREGLASQSRNLLGADLAVDARMFGTESRVPAELDDHMVELAPGHERTDTYEMASMVAAAVPEGAPPGRSQLANLKVVRGRFPLHGELVLEPQAALDELLGNDGVAADPELLRVLDLDIGDELLVGGERFVVRAAVLDEPDRLDFSLTLGPRVFLSKAGLDRTQLLGFGSRVRHRALFLLPPGAPAAEALKDILEERLAEHELVDVDSHERAQPGLQRSVGRLENTLGLVALLSLLLGGTGVAQIVRAWIAARLRAFATLRCLGLRPRELLLMALGHVAGLALIGSLLGAALGMSLPWLLSQALPELLPSELVVAWQPWALLRGVALGVGVALLFAAPPLAALWRVSPALVLRADAQPLPAPRFVSIACWGTLLVGLFAAAWWQSERVEQAGAFIGGLVVLVLLMSGVARALTGLAGRLPRERLSPYVLNGVAALGRPSAGTRGALVALGLGVLVVLAMEVIGARISSEMRGALPEEAPSAFFVDIQRDQWGGVQTVLQEEGARNVESVPILMARFRAVDGVSVDDLREAAREEGGGRRRGRGRWGFRGERRLTWMESLPEDNTIVAGELWSQPGVDEASLEADFAEDHGLGLGSVLAFDVQGVPVELTVTSLREVEWRSFGINFFLVVEPGVLDDAPHARLATARLDDDSGADLTAPVQDRLAVAYPNVTLLDVRRILSKLAELLDRLAMGIRALGLFTVFTGLAVLAGSVSAHAWRRRREAALLKTLGVTRKGVASLLAIEYGLLGLVAGALGALGALTLAWAFLKWVTELPGEIPWWWLPVAALLTATLAALSGLAASAKALRVRPAESLRG
ncbi:MAG: permease [Planctomycetota bacterium]|nr:MAG: permease [Planctomycetota bacterium]